MLSDYLKENIKRNEKEMVIGSIPEYDKQKQHPGTYEQIEKEKCEKKPKKRNY
jgi:hypothetical protein